MRGVVSVGCQVPQVPERVNTKKPAWFGLKDPGVLSSAQEPCWLQTLPWLFTFCSWKVLEAAFWVMQAALRCCRLLPGVVR